MREETVVKYIADDGISFGENKAACEAYEKLCEKTKFWIKKGTIMFWDRKEHFMNFDLIEPSLESSTNYLDWLRKQLVSCQFIVINTQPGEDLWSEVWEFVCKYRGFSDREIAKLQVDYREGDLLAFEPQDCMFHNFSLVARRTTEVHERLNLKLANAMMANKDKWEI